MHPGLKGTFRFDFAVYDAEGHLSALVEAKRRLGMTITWAREWHDMLLERMNRPIAVNVALVLPDRIYVWRPGASTSADPDWTFDAEPWLMPYFTRLKIAATEVDAHGFEEIVGIWLRDVTQGDVADGSDAGPATELLGALVGGEVLQQVAA